LPSRRVYIPKPDGRQRPLAVAALEDKIVQRATIAVLNAIYEEDFLGFSYGFRPKRGQHDALDALVVGITTRKVNFILDADIRSYFDSVNQAWLIRFLKHRINDPRMIRLIQKWLKAGILENGVVTISETGTGQGSVVSPLLANVYLHYVFDLWAERWRRREASGDMILVRYADDIIIGFQYESDARRFWDAMRQRLAEYSLSLHPDKTRLIEFGRFAADQRARRGLGKPETFTFLGFTFICGRSRRGRFTLKRKSRGDRMRATLKEIKKELRRRMHQPIPEQGKWLRQVVTGFLAYHAVPTNSRALIAFRHHVTNLWRRSLRRRSQRDRMTWDRIRRLADDFLPKARILQPWPHARFAVKHPRREPSALIGPARIWCSEASCHSSGCKSRQHRSPVAVVVISRNGEGDRSVESREVKAPGGWAFQSDPYRGASKLTGCSKCVNQEAPKTGPARNGLRESWECRAAQISAKATSASTLWTETMTELPGVKEDGMSGRNGQRKPGTTRGSPRRSRTAKASRINRRAVKSRCACEWGGWGRVSDDGSGHYNPNLSEGPWGGGSPILHGSALSSPRPDTVRDYRCDHEAHEGRRQTDRRSAHAGSRLKLIDVPGRSRLIRQPSSRIGENPPYGMIGGDRGNVGIIRSPVRASILPDCGGRLAISVPTAII
jgi:RNA-directed DNA polymerase